MYSILTGTDEHGAFLRLLGPEDSLPAGGSRGPRSARLRDQLFALQHLRSGGRVFSSVLDTDAGLAEPAVDRRSA